MHTHTTEKLTVSPIFGLSSEIKKEIVIKHTYMHICMYVRMYACMHA